MAVAVETARASQQRCFFKNGREMSDFETIIICH